MGEEMELILGVDLSTVRQAEKGKTCVAVAEGCEAGIILHEVLMPEDDEALIALLSQPYTRCGIDAPLGLPPCVLCRAMPCDCPISTWMELLGQGPQAAYHYRLSDLVVRSCLSGVHPKPPLSTGGPVDITPLTMRWLRLARQLATRGCSLRQIVEVYATGAIQLYAQHFGLTAHQTYHYRSSEARRTTLIENLCDVGRLTASDMLWDQMVGSEDVLDAVMACLSAWHSLRGSVLLPQTLLDLNSNGEAAFALAGIPREVREAMLEHLLRSPWVMLPALSEAHNPSSNR